MIRSDNPEHANWLVNHPGIRPFIGGDGKSFVDLTAAVLNNDNYLLLGDHGGFMLTWTAPGTFEVHTFILPEGRGRAALELASEAREYMVSQGMQHLWTRVPIGARNVRRFTMAMGLVPCGFQTCDFGGGPVEYELFEWRHECQQQQLAA